MMHAAGLSIAAWVVLSDRYRVHIRLNEECDRLVHAYQLDGGAQFEHPAPTLGAKR
jgi:hypothetical protein